MNHDLRCPFLLKEFKRQQHGRRVGYQARAAYTHTCEINSFVDTVRRILKTKGFFISNILFSAFDVVNPELHQRLNARHPSTHGSLEYRIERNKWLRPLMYLLKN